MEIRAEAAAAAVEHARGDILSSSCERCLRAVVTQSASRVPIRLRGTYYSRYLPLTGLRVPCIVRHIPGSAWRVR